MSEKIIGRNAVTEALNSDREIEKIILAKGAEGSIKKIEGKAKARKIPLYYSDKSRMDRDAEGGNHQGVIAIVSDYEYATVEDILDVAKRRGEDPFVILLDGLEDPHNLGAIMRTAECAGAHGVIIPKRRSVSVTETVAKTSAGAVEYMPCARVTNMARTIEQLQEAGLWIAACDMDGDTLTEANLNGPIGIVIGSEGFGVSRLVREKCDFIVSIPMKGRITSLNASNAASILMYEIVRQRGDSMKAVTDQQMVIRAQQGDLEAEETLMRKYKEIVKIKSQYYYMAGADEDDVIQEGMIGLLKAIRQYDPEKEAGFATFAGICITRQIISAIRMADREKHKPLNTSISLNKPVGGEEEGVTLEDTLTVSDGESPEALLVVKDLAYYIMHNEDSVFSNFEMQVLNKMVRENDYEEIARRLGRSRKSIDNAMQRIKKKS